MQLGSLGPNPAESLQDAELRCRFARPGPSIGSGVQQPARPLPEIETILGVAGLSDLPNFRIFSTLKEALEVVDQG